MEPHIYGVTEVNQLVKGLLDSAPALQGVAVRGELSNYKIYPSGHHYFTLKDSEGALRCVMFRGQASRLRFRPENGMKAVASGRITVFPRDGAYQLYCDSLIPEGVGDLAVAFQQLKERLAAQGLFRREAFPGEYVRVVDTVFLTAVYWLPFCEIKGEVSSFRTQAWSTLHPLLTEAGRQAVAPIVPSLGAGGTPADP